MKKAAQTKVTITTEGKTIEVSGLTLQEIKDLVGLNGHVNVGGRAGFRAAAGKSVSAKTISGEPDYAGFWKALSEKGKKFVEILKQHSTMQADELAEKMGFQSPTQIGGTTGGGMSRLAPKFGVELDNVYTSEITFNGGVRKTIYKAGKDISKLH